MYRSLSERLADYGSSVRRLDSVTDDQASELYELNNEKAWIFEPSTRKAYLEADPDCEFALQGLNLAIYTDEDRLTAHKVLDILGVAP